MKQRKLVTLRYVTLCKILAGRARPSFLSSPVFTSIQVGAEDSFTPYTTLQMSVCLFTLLHLKESYVAYSHYSNFVLYQYTSTTLFQQCCRFTFCYSIV